jgi:ribosome-associated protein
LDLTRTRGIEDEVRELLVRRLGQTVRVVVDRTRSQDRNRELALRQIEQRLQEARVERRARRPTKPGRGAVQRRLTAKKQKSQRKSDRRRDWRAE